MRIKSWMRRFLLRWTPKNRSIRRLGQELGIESRIVFDIVALIEADSVSIARQRMLKNQTIQQLAKEFGIEQKPIDDIVASIEADSVNLARQIVLDAWQKARPPRTPDLERPSNRNISGARLSS